MLDASYRQLAELLGKKLSLKELEDSLFDMGMELEAEGDCLHIEVTPDRPDLISTQGLARALKAYLKIKLGMPMYIVKKSDIRVIVKPSVKDVRPYTVAAVVKKLKFDEEKIKEIIWIQEKLHATFARDRKKAAIGIYPLEHITPPITYSAEDPDKVKFMPLEESQEMTGRQVLSRTSTGRQYAKLLEGHEKFPFFIDSRGDVLSMPPIINSSKLGKITGRTEEVFIECSGHNLKDLQIVLNILVTVLADMGGHVYSVELQYGNKKVTTPNLAPERRSIGVKYINSVLGTKLTTPQVKLLLRRMLYDIKSARGDTVELLVPAFRSDVWHDVDVADDVGRAYGFSNIIPGHRDTAGVGGTTRDVKLQEDVQRLMVSLGYQQAVTLALTSTDDQFVKMNLKEFDHIRLGSVEDKSLNMVRIWLIPGLMKCLVNNRNREYPQKFFETGFVVKPDGKADVRSRNILRFAAVTAHKNASYTEVKQAMEYVLDNLDLSYAIEEVEHSSFIPGRVGRVAVNGKKVGFIGEVHPQVLLNLGLEVPVSAVEVNFTDIFEE